MIPSDMPVLGDAVYDIIVGSGPDPLEQMLIELVNRARLDPLGEAARYGTQESDLATLLPLWALAPVAELNYAATKHSQAQIDREFFDHIDPLDGSTPTVRAAREGFTFGVGENIGLIASTVDTGFTQARVESHHQNLWNSQGHQDNMLGGGYSVVGAGHAEGPYELEVEFADGTMGPYTFDHTSIMTEKFSDTGLRYITGVVIDDQDMDQFYDVGEGQQNVRVTAYNDDGAYGTTTWGSGGYALAVPAGTYTVVFEGGDLSAPISFANVVVPTFAPTVKLDAFEGTPGNYVEPVTGTAFLFVQEPDAATGDMVGTDANEIFETFTSNFQTFTLGGGADLISTTYSTENNTFQKFTFTDFDVTQDFVALPDGTEVTRKWRNADNDLVLKISAGNRDDILVFEGDMNSRDIRFFTQGDLRAIDDSPETAAGDPFTLPFLFETGSNDSDTMVGTDADELFFSFKGRLDTMETGGGNDKIVLGSDTSNGRSDKDVVTDFDTSMDEIIFTPGVEIDRQWYNSSGDLVMRLTGTDGDVLVLQGGVNVDDVMITYVPLEDMMM